MNKPTAIQFGIHKFNDGMRMDGDGEKRSKRVAGERERKKKGNRVYSLYFDRFYIRLVYLFVYLLCRVMCALYCML